MASTTIPDLDSLMARTVCFADDRVTVVRPGLALVLYSYAPFGEVMRASADVLDLFVNVVPSGTRLYSYGPPDDAGAPDDFLAFGPSERATMLRQLRTGAVSNDDEGFGLAIYSTDDGQAQQYGFQLGAIDVDADEEGSMDGDESPSQSAELTETSMLRLEFPWDLVESRRAEQFLEFVTRVANVFPFCSGTAGFSHLYTVGYATAARQEIQNLCRRFIGFDTAYSSAQLAMRRRSPSVHWLNLIDGDLLAKLGGYVELAQRLGPCQLVNLAGGVLIRSARFPQVADVDRGALDIGCMPLVAKALEPIRMTAGDYVGLPDRESGLAWLARFDRLADKDWENSLA